MPGPYATPKTWHCDGCGKPHSISIDIEGLDGLRKWCAASIIRGIRTGRNDLPPQHEHFRRHFLEGSMQ
jgi:hypothetical protein